MNEPVEPDVSAESVKKPTYVNLFNVVRSKSEVILAFGTALPKVVSEERPPVEQTYYSRYVMTTNGGQTLTKLLVTMLWGKDAADKLPPLTE